MWVQLHNVAPLNMTEAATSAIASLIGKVVKVDKDDGRDCIGRFLRVKISFDVQELLMRGANVEFPDDGKIWIDFHYEGLPNYCLICDKVGHVTRWCKAERLGELLHSMKLGNDEGINFMALKLDMAKGYDRVEWSFLNAMLHKLRFDDIFCQWVMKCVQTIPYCVVVNGEATSYITPSRGLRQRGPLSLFLFLNCVEGFSSLLHNEERVGRIRGIIVNNLAEPLSYVFFANDLVFFCQATKIEALNVNCLLQQDAEGSGQFINLEKSSVHFSGGCSQVVKAWLSQVLGIKHQDGFGKYLGIQADFGGLKRKVFEDVRNRVDEQINGWAKQFQSIAGNEVLIKSVAVALPNYTMSCFQLPIQLAKEIEQVIARFLWRDQKTKKGVHWVAWSKVAKRKSKGGLGFKEIISLNLAMLAKVGWHIICNPDSLLAKVLQEKYYLSSSFLDGPAGRGTSWGWKGILYQRKVFKVGIRWRVGDGRSIQIVKDPWLPTPRTFH
ncbi:uncharacterized protein [Pyrus communis]|uniref:uncharacterized protein n=1 Tax=Pyrus communis TaxID=23211 RepID=UPI0035C09624